METLTYTVNSLEGNYAYNIQAGEEKISIPAQTLLLNIDTGSLAYVTAMTTEGEDINVLGTFTPKEEQSGYTVMVDIEPRKDVLIEDGIIYDYYFLYLQSHSGESTLDLVCNEIDWEKQTTEVKIFHKLNLLENKADESVATEKMFSDYREVYRKILALP